MRATRRISAIALALVFTGAAVASAAGGTVLVTPDSTEWYFSDVHQNEAGVGGPTEGSTGEIAEAPPGGPWGDHSYRLEVNNGTEKARVMTDNYNGRPLADLEGVTYSTNKSGLPGYAPAINVIIDPEGDDDFVTLVWEANKAEGTILENTWQSWDTTEGAGWWTPSIQPFSSLTPGSNRTPTTLATLSALYGDATIIGFAVNVGRHDAMTAFVDGVGVTMAGETTTYDFGLATPTKDDCKNGGWAALGFSNQGRCVSSFTASPRAGK